MIKNTIHTYGLVAKTLHWVSAITIISLFFLGIWMVDLDYDHDWYYPAPHYHESFGILLALLIIFRLIWRWVNISPTPSITTSTLEKRIAHLTHIIIYLSILIILISGYLIPTSDNRGIEVFTWFTVPSLGELIDQQTDIAGKIHYWLSYGLMGLISIHVLAALKHHFINQDNTLTKMLFFKQP